MSPFILQQKDIAPICEANCKTSDVKPASMPDFPLQEGGRKFEKGLSRTDLKSEKVSRRAVSCIQPRSCKSNGQQAMESRVRASQCAAYSEKRVWMLGRREIETAEPRVQK